MNSSICFLDLAIRLVELQHADFVLVHRRHLTSEIEEQFACMSLTSSTEGKSEDSMRILYSLEDGFNCILDNIVYDVPISLRKDIRRNVYYLENKNHRWYIVGSSMEHMKIVLDALQIRGVSIGL